MKRQRMNFTESHAMASGVDGTQPGVAADDYAQHVLERSGHFSETIVEGAVAHLYRAGLSPERPETMSKGQWADMHWEEMNP
jgi:hypothetical protein